MIKNADEVESLALQAKSTEDVEFVPAFTGLGSPYWKADARGMISGLTRGCNKAQYCKSCIRSYGPAKLRDDLVYRKRLSKAKKS